MKLAFPALAVATVLASAYTVLAAPPPQDTLGFEFRLIPASPTGFRAATTRLGATCRLTNGWSKWLTEVQVGKVKADKGSADQQ